MVFILILLFYNVVIYGSINVIGENMYVIDIIIGRLSFNFFFVLVINIVNLVYKVYL